MIPRRTKSYDFKYLNENDINNDKCTFEGLAKVSPYLNKNNAETYKIFLASRPDLGETVKEYYLNLINKMEQNQQREIDQALKIYKDVSEYQK